MTIAQALAGLGAAASVLYLLAFCWAGPSTVKSVVKTVAVGALAVVAWLAGAPGLLVLALALGSLGDFFLSREGDRAFLAGLVAFALAHLAYVPLFLGTDGWSWATYASPHGIVLVGFAVYAVWLARKLWTKAGALRGAVVAYIVIIFAMVGAALGLDRPVIILGAMLFALSDSVLSAELFLLRPDHPARRWTAFVIWPTYWTAQALFLLAYI